MTITCKGLKLTINKNGTYRCTSYCNIKKTTHKTTENNFNNAMLYLYHMADNNDIGNEMVEKCCKKTGKQNPFTF